MEQWYYVDAGERCGPLDRKRLQDLLDEGSITPETLVWEAGMDQWRPASCVFDSQKRQSKRKAGKSDDCPENHFAVAGFIVSLLALPLAPFTCGLSAIPAMVFSIMGLIHTFHHPKSGRRKLAIVGFLISILSFLMPIAIALGIAYFLTRS